MRAAVSLLTVVLGLLTLVHSPASAAPLIHWTPDAVTANVTKGGEPENVPITLRAVEDLTDVVIRVVPALSRYVTVTPSSIPSLRAGESMVIHLTMRAPAEAPDALVTGTLQVRRRVAGRGQGRVLARPLPVSIAIQDTQSIAGADRDANGVWDYVDSYLEQNYGTVSPAERAALRKFAAALQAALLNASDRVQALQRAEDVDRATECLYGVQPVDAGRTLEDLKSAILNTPTRSRAYLMWSEQSAGQVFRARPRWQRTASCVSL